MNRAIVGCVLSGVLSTLILAQTPVPKADETRDREALLKLVNDLTVAKTKRDVAALNRLLADEYVLTNPAGFVADKSEYLDGAKADTAVYESVTNSDQVVKLYGNAGVVTGATTVKGRYDGNDIGGQFRFTHVFVRRQDRWQAVATQLTRIAQQ